jgi:hypothetical protein
VMSFTPRRVTRLEETVLMQLPLSIMTLQFVEPHLTYVWKMLLLHQSSFSLGRVRAHLTTISLGPSVASSGRLAWGDMTLIHPKHFVSPS